MAFGDRHAARAIKIEIYRTPPLSRPEVSVGANNRWGV
jgi:hypothetical protein